MLRSSANVPTVRVHIGPKADLVQVLCTNARLGDVFQDTNLCCFKDTEMTFPLIPALERLHLI